MELEVNMAANKNLSLIPPWHVPTSSQSQQKMDGCMELLAWNYAIKNLMGYHLLPTINLIDKKFVLLPLRVMPFGVLGSSGLRLRRSPEIWNCCCQLLPDPVFTASYYFSEHSLALSDDAGNRVVVRPVVGEGGCIDSGWISAMVSLVQNTWKGTIMAAFNTFNNW